MKNFQQGDIVEWKTNNIYYRGKVVLIVPPGSEGETLSIGLRGQGYIRFYRGNSWMPRSVRPRVSYLVAIGRKIYWPKKPVLVKRDISIPTLTGMVRWMCNSFLGREVKAA